MLPPSPRSYRLDTLQGTFRMVPTVGEPTPVETQISALLEALKATRAQEQPHFTVAELIATLGPSSHILVILVFSVLNMIPGPPGYGGTVAIAIIGFAIAMIMNAPITLPHWIGDRHLPVRALRRVAGLFAGIAGFIGRFSRPRLVKLSAPSKRPVLGLFIIAVSLPMILPVPFINAVPNVGICVLCLGWLNRDALMIIFGMIIAMIGLGIAGLAIWGSYQLLNAAIGAMQ